MGIKLCLCEPLSDEAHRLFAMAGGAAPRPFFVPDLFYVECANILWKQMRRTGYPADKAARDLGLLRALRVTAIPTADLVDDALALAAPYDITAYDACYVALAERMGVDLVTADEKLVRKLENTAHEATWLGDPGLFEAP